MKVSARGASRRRTNQGEGCGARTSSRAGISLVEVMVAIVVLLIASSAAFMSQLTSMRMVDQSREIAVAMSDLEACMDRVRTSPVDELAVAGSIYEHGESVDQYDDLHLRDQRIVVTYPGFVPGGPLPEPLQVVLDVTWSTRRGGQVNQRLQTVRVR